MIRFLRFLGEARNKPPLHAMNNGLFALSPAPSPNHWQIRPRWHIIRRPIPEKNIYKIKKIKTHIDFTEWTVNRKGAIWRVRVLSYRSIWIFWVGRVLRLHARAMLSGLRVQRALPHMVFSDTNLFLFFGVLREVKGGSAGSGLAVCFSFAGRWMGVGFEIWVDSSQCCRIEADWVYFYKK